MGFCQIVENKFHLLLTIYTYMHNSSQNVILQYCRVNHISGLDPSCSPLSAAIGLVTLSLQQHFCQTDRVTKENLGYLVFP